MQIQKCVEDFMSEKRKRVISYFLAINLTDINLYCLVFDVKADLYSKKKKKRHVKMRGNDRLEDCIFVKSHFLARSRAIATTFVRIYVLDEAEVEADKNRWNKHSRASEGG